MPDDTEKPQLGIEARRLIRSRGHAALGTSLAGRPYVSLVAAACDGDASARSSIGDWRYNAERCWFRARIDYEMALA